MSLDISTPVSLPSSSTFLFSRSLRPLQRPTTRSMLQLPRFDHKAAIWASGCGLPTPPTANMSTAYHPPATLESHAIPKYTSSGHIGRANMAVGDPNNPQLYRLTTTKPREQPHPYSQRQLQPQLQPQTQPQPQPQHSLNQDALNYFLVDGGGFPRPTAESTAAPQHSTQPPAPVAEEKLKVPSGGLSSTRSSDTLVYHSLTIPRCISPNGGNLAELAAQMTCLFWFESVDQLKHAECFQAGQQSSIVTRLPSLAKPDAQFRKWVLSVLSTTQVTQNVILLALLFIYRLKMSTPQIKGREGSEYRLLIVALMLGNKFLDDNTYTNKTWAEVSCFQVKEIHVMEVEFLSNMRYNLLASKGEWESWLQKLSCFHEYYDQALRLPASPIHAIPPSYVSPIPSPTGTMPPILPEMAPVTPTKMTTLPPRKRSLEDTTPDHPAKRPAPGVRLSMPTAPQNINYSASTRLPAPLSITTNQVHNLPPPHTGTHAQSSYNAPTGYLPPSAHMQNQVSLPPLQPGMRAMSTVYHQPPQVNIAPPQPMSTTMTSALPSTSFPASTLPSQTPGGYGSAPKRHSPGSLTPFASSPMPDPFSAGPVVHTPIANSPTVYLQHRNSPYRPIRHVNTLLYPPPSASLDQYHLGVPIPPTQMHYQPIGRRNDVRTGIVPEFVVYNRGQHQSLPPHMTPHGHYAN